jgi:hypothetical protein
MFDKYYNNFKTGTIQKNHVFRFNTQDSALNMKCAMHDGAEFIPQTMLKNGATLCDARAKDIQEFALETLKPHVLSQSNRLIFIKSFDHLYLGSTGKKHVQSRPRK